MIKHIVVFRFKPGTDVSEHEALLTSLNEFPKRFKAMRNWTLGRNISQRDDTFTHGLVVEFESEKDLVEYLNSEMHEEFVANSFRPLIEARAIISYEY